MGKTTPEGMPDQWPALLNAIFRGPIPEYIHWVGKKEIMKTLYRLGDNPELNRIFLPDLGIHQLKRADDSAETNCIELHFMDHPPCIIKPNLLTFHSFGQPYDWAYFRLETDALQPSGWYPELEGIKEELVEISPGDYAHRMYWDIGFYEYDETGREQPLSSRARIVFRYFSGAFVIFSAWSPYQYIDLAPAGLHGRMNEEAFREFVGHQIKK